MANSIETVFHAFDAKANMPRSIVRSFARALVTQFIRFQFILVALSLDSHAIIRVANSHE